MVVRIGVVARTGELMGRIVMELPLLEFDFAWAEVVVDSSK